VFRISFSQTQNRDLPVFFTFLFYLRIVTEVGLLQYFKDDQIHNEATCAIVAPRKIGNVSINLPFVYNLINSNTQ